MRRRILLFEAIVTLATSSCVSGPHISTSGVEPQSSQDFSELADSKYTIVPQGTFLLSSPYLQFGDSYLSAIRENPTIAVGSRPWFIYRWPEFLATEALLYGVWAASDCTIQCYLDWRNDMIGYQMLAVDVYLDEGCSFPIATFYPNIFTYYRTSIQGKGMTWQDVWVSFMGIYFEMPLKEGQTIYLLVHTDRNAPRGQMSTFLIDFKENSENILSYVIPAISKPLITS